MGKVDTIGYVKSWRKSMNTDVFKNAKAWQLFCFCIWCAHFSKKDKNYGTFETTYPEIMEVCEMGRNSVDKYLKFLKEQNVIDYWTNHQKTYIKVINYEKYQGGS